MVSSWNEELDPRKVREMSPSERGRQLRVLRCAEDSFIGHVQQGWDPTLTFIDKTIDRHLEIMERNRELLCP